jgi:hypothetical protein
MVALKNTAHFERYVSAIQLEMEKVKNNCGCAERIFAV